jgi:hypothetical protein
VVERLEAGRDVRGCVEALQGGKRGGQGPVELPMPKGGFDCRERWIRHVFAKGENIAKTGRMIKQVKFRPS